MTENDAMIYVRGLGRDRVTSRQKQVLLRIADHWSARYQCANLANEDLCEDMLLTPRHLRRILGAIAATGLLDYMPGLGAGNFSQFRFPGLPVRERRAIPAAVPIPEQEAVEARTIGEAKGTESGQKGDILGTAIRKDLNQDQKLNPPNPPSSKGGINLITVRQVRELRNRIAAAMDDDVPILAAIEAACQAMLFPVDAAIKLLYDCGRDELAADLRVVATERKPPRKAEAG